MPRVSRPPNTALGIRCCPQPTTPTRRFLSQGRGAGVTITPYAAGRMIGAAVWRVSWQTEDNDIVYATAYNHNRER